MSLRAVRGHRLDRKPYLLTCVAVLLSLTLQFPSIDVYFGPEFEHTWQAFEEQVRHPLTPQIHSPSSHEAKRSLRLTVPLLANALGLDRHGGYLLNAAFQVGLFAFIPGLIANGAAGGSMAGALTCLGLAGLSAGSTGFVDLRGVFDATGLFCLCVTMGARCALGAGLSLLAALFVDERVFLTTPFLLLWLHVRRQGVPKAVVPTAVFLWLGVRWLLAALFGLTTPIRSSAGVGILELVHNIHSLPVATWQGLEGFWLIVCATVICLWTQRSWFDLGLLGLGCVMVVTGAGVVVDQSRGALYLLPLIPISVAVVRRGEGGRMLSRLLVAAAWISLAGPTLGVGGRTITWWLPLPFQIVRLAWAAFAHGE